MGKTGGKKEKQERESNGRYVNGHKKGADRKRNKGGNGDRGNNGGEYKRG